MLPDNRSSQFLDIGMSLDLLLERDETALRDSAAAIPLCEFDKSTSRTKTLPQDAARIVRETPVEEMCRLNRCNALLDISAAKTVSGIQWIEQADAEAAALSEQAIYLSRSKEQGCCNKVPHLPMHRSHQAPLGLPHPDCMMPILQKGQDPPEQ